MYAMRWRDGWCMISHSRLRQRSSARVGAVNTRFIDVIPYGNALVCWTNDGMTLYDITDKTAPTLIKKIS